MSLLITKQIFLWIHLISMLGCFGMVLGSLAAGRSHTVDTRRRDKTLSMAAMAMGVGLLAGIGAFIVKVRLFQELPPMFMMFIMIKFLLLLAAGALLATDAKKLRSEARQIARTGSIVSAILIAVAALLGVFLAPTA